ncbi:MAG TPA: bifunctional 2-polyprenyl-6-hydroxyphenol methylase/3-demethylubiquinol 3-O-methyltransferase UbiG [Bradyrhizobium sp.]|nr:bifunctional 2-polyprenyl-6-hydroxyphenol methylase/3-demethylubiquinol 3-O-methyltransferase UbiG [Bradyrhizobium sp.]
MLRKDIVRPAIVDGTVDPIEIERFEALADEWWKPGGKFKTVHAFNAARLGAIGDILAPSVSAPPSGEGPLSGLRIADIGCGAGLIAEPLAARGASVVAIDAAGNNIAMARRHAAQSGIVVDYRCSTPDRLVEAGERFDAVLCLEVVEHVADLPAFLAQTAALVAPGGLMVIGTLNRTAKSYALAIIGAEYVLGWLPRGTHAWRRFVKPSELAALLACHGLAETRRQGVAFDPLRWRWSLSTDISVNYLMAFRRPATSSSAEPSSLTVYFDGSCPLCRAEIAHYQRQDGADRLQFTDVSEPAARLPSDLSRERAMARFHVRASDGRLVSGAEAFVSIWRLLPRWRFAAKLADLPGMLTLIEAGYRIFLPVRPLMARLFAKFRAARMGDHS